MNKIIVFILSIAVLPFMLSASPTGETRESSAAAAPSEAPAELLETYGYLIALEIGLTDFGFTATEVDAVLRGLRSALENEPEPAGLDAIGPALQAFLIGRYEEVSAQRREENQAKSRVLFEELDEQPAVEKTDSGLYYEELAAGEGASPSSGDRVSIHYEGRFIGGEVFDSSYARNEPAELDLNRVIPGMTEGIRLMREGGKMRLYIPASLGYGDRGQGSIPPGATLIFDVELLEVISEDGE